MQTQTHALLALTLFAKPRARLRNWAAFAGAMVTDLFIYIGFAWHVGAQGQSAQIFFRDTYFAPPMQFWSALSNSLPIFMAIAAIAYFIKNKKTGTAVFIFALAALSQAAIDLPVHADDAHRHFWPLTDWRFISPVSYWDPAHYGRIVGPLDALLGTVCAVILWRRFDRVWARAILALLITAYALFALLSLSAAL